MSRIFRSLLISSIFISSGCALQQTLASAGSYARVLLGREKLDRVINRGELSQEKTAKLRLVRKTLDFAASHGFNAGGAYSSFAEVGDEPLAWVLVAARPTSLQPKEWWFPIVGTVPYLGFSSPAPAMKAAEQLRAHGWETSVRPTVAFSTLGWFDDPILSSMLRRSSVELSELILHELTHRTLWIPGSVPFNESLANFVGITAVVVFAESENSETHSAGELREHNVNFVAEAKQLRDRSITLASTVDGLHEALTELFQSAAEVETKRMMRDSLFAERVAPLHAAGWTNLLREPNNAEFIQLAIYCKGLPLFQRAFDKVGHSFPRFFALMRDVGQRSQSESLPPFDVLQKMLARD